MNIKKIRTYTFVDWIQIILSLLIVVGYAWHYLINELNCFTVPFYALILSGIGFLLGKRAFPDMFRYVDESNEDTNLDKYQRILSGELKWPKNKEFNQKFLGTVALQNEVERLKEKIDLRKTLTPITRGPKFYLTFFLTIVLGWSLWIYFITYKHTNKKYHTIYSSDQLSVWEDEVKLFPTQFKIYNKIPKYRTTIIDQTNEDGINYLATIEYYIVPDSLNIIYGFDESESRISYLKKFEEENLELFQTSICNGYRPNRLAPGIKDSFNIDVRRIDFTISD